MGRAVGVMLFALAAQGCVPKVHFVRIAEGLTSPTITEGIRVAPRMFSAPSLVAACNKAVPVDRLEVEPQTLTLTRGTQYALNTLSVVAVSAADTALEAQPIVLEVEDSRTQILALRSDDLVLNQGQLLAVDVGPFLVRVRTMCGTAYAETVIKGQVVQ